GSGRSRPDVVFFWYAGLSWLLVWRVFRSPTIDYRLVMLGSVLPSVDILIGRPTPLHTLAGAVAAFGLVAVATRNRRLEARRWVGIPIGMFFHLVLDGSWADADLFWWPLTGVSLAELSVPELQWPVAVVVAAELVGLAVLGWLWLRFDLGDPDRRAVFRSTGHVARELA
ncbi:MAG: hypothetical protein AAGK32_16370, partial [Actinomycetota bacterium]